MEVVKYEQTGNVQSEVEALIAVVNPILKGLLFSLKRELVEVVGGLDKITLELLARLYKPGDGDCGICFEYAVHDAIVSNDGSVLERIDEALKRYCKIKGGAPTSILFGAEKSGTLQLIDTVSEHLTESSVLLTGVRGQPVKLKRHINGVLTAFKKPSERENLPSSINGLWKADLFVGRVEPDKWVGTTVKINPAHLEPAKGLRLAIVPSKQGRNDKVYQHDLKNLVVCPVPYDQSFMEIFYQGWLIVKQFLNADAKLPTEVLLSRGADRQVCKFYEDRRKFPVLEVINAMDVISQPGFLKESSKIVSIDLQKNDKIKLNRIIAPVSNSGIL